MQGFLGTFVIPAILAIFRATTDNGGYPTEHAVDVKSGTETDCWEQYGKDNSNAPPGASFIDIAGINNVRYYNIFKRKPANGPPSPIFIDNKLYDCWNEEYETVFASITSKVGVKTMFASFLPSHAEAMGEMADVLIQNMINNDGANSRAVEFMTYLRQRGDIHPQLFVSAVPIALVGSGSSLIGIKTPTILEMFPSRFLPNSVPTTPIHPQGGVFRVAGDDKCVRVNELWGLTKTNGIENRLWYFREDVQLNSHHWNWHQFKSTRSLKQIPRRGELFYFFHHDLMARYGAERLANGFRDYFVEGIKPVVGYELKQGYDSNLRDGVSAYNWVNRVNNTKLNQTSVPADEFLRLQKHVTWWNHVKAITETDQVMDNNNVSIPLFPKPDGINTIGELFEASKYGLNKYFYGDFGWHNAAHDILGSVILEPNQETLGEVGVLADVATAVRDMYFYRIHNEVNRMFMSYKHTILKPYELSGAEHPLIVPGIVTKSIQVTSSGNLRNTGDSINNLTTFWNNHNMVLDGGLDIEPDTKLRLDVCLKHLDHQEFTYNIHLENTGQGDRPAYVRIFMAPRYNLDRVRFNLTEQFKLFFTMDAFSVTLRPGDNAISRSSLDSTVTKPWFQLTAGPDIQPDWNTCSCGYPHHLLLPKGYDDDSGVYDLVAVVTDGSDFVGLPTDPCASSYMHCGRINGDQDYPDKKPMGWPFDRRPSPELSQVYLDKLLQQVPNMAAATVTIFHNDNNPKEHVV